MDSSFDRDAILTRALDCMLRKSDPTKAQIMVDLSAQRGMPYFGKADLTEALAEGVRRGWISVERGQDGKRHYGTTNQLPGNRRASTVRKAS